MERSSFFNAVVTGIDESGLPKYDRSYKAENFAEFFASFIGNGVFPNPASNCQVIAVDNNMNIRIKAGKAWINGYYYVNTDDCIHTIEVADSLLNRIDRVVLRLDFINREIKSYVKKGAFSSTPIAPILQRDADAYEICLSEIKVNKGIIKISQVDITDTRLNNNLCGIVHGTIDQVDTSEIFRQYQAWFLDNKVKSENDLIYWFNSFKTNADKSLSNFQIEWDTWFNTIKTELNGDIAGNLLNKITSVEGDVSQIKTEITSQKSDYMYQTPTIVGTQIQIKKQSDSNRLYFKLSTDLNGNIKISLDGGLTEKPLVDVDGVQLTELEKGFVEVVAEANFFILRSRSGLKKSDKQALIDIVNSGLLNESELKTNIINALNTINTDGEKLSTDALWGDVLSRIPNIKTGRKWASGIGTGSGENPFTINNLTFSPSIVYIKVRQNTGRWGEDILFCKERFHTGTYNINGIITIGDINGIYSPTVKQLSNDPASTLCAICTSDGFSVKGSSYLINQNYTHNWIAIE